MPETTLKQCAVCQNFAHCTAAGYCNCGAYSVRQETTTAIRWEYRQLHYSMSEFNDHMRDLNRLGAEGWEHYFYSQSAQSYRYFFRRPLKENT